MFGELMVEGVGNSSELYSWFSDVNIYAHTEFCIFFLKNILAASQ